MDRSPEDQAPSSSDAAERISPLARRRGVALAGDQLSAMIERRPWTVLAIALGLGAALAAVTGGSDEYGMAESPDDGDDYLAEYEDALVAGSPRWASYGRDAMSRLFPGHDRGGAA